MSNLALACVKSAQCVLVGTDDPVDGDGSGFAAIHDPGGAAQVQIPLPDGITDSELTVGKVACSSSGVCSAVALLRPDAATTPAQSVLIAIGV